MSLDNNSDNNNISKQEEISSSILSSPADNIFIDYKEYYSCSKCSSNIEIISIDHNESKITFKCLNCDKEKNHKIQTLPIGEYIKKMENYTYLSDKCSICYKEQSSLKNFFCHKFCVNCNVVVCNECKEKHINNNYNKHYLINNNEKRIKCLLHPDNINSEYCLKCKMHLCEECLNTREHLEHETKSLGHILPTIKEKESFKQNIESLKNRKKDLENEKTNKILEYNKKINEIRLKNKNEYESRLKLVESEEKKELENNELKMKEKLNEAKLKYENEIKKINEYYTINEKKIKDEHKYIKEDLKKAFNNEICRLSNKLFIDYDSKKIDKKIGNLEDLISIHEIIQKTQEKYTNNYYNNINLLNALSFFEKNKTRKKQKENEKEKESEKESDNENESNKSNDSELNEKNNYNNIPPILEDNKITKPKLERHSYLPNKEEKINSNSFNFNQINININKEKNNNNISNTKINNQLLNEIEKLKSQNNQLKIENMNLKEKNISSDINKIEQKKEHNSKMRIDSPRKKERGNKNLDINKIEQKKHNTKMQIQSPRKKEKEKKLPEIKYSEIKRINSVTKIEKSRKNNIISKMQSFDTISQGNDKTIFDSYCATDIDNSFLVFISINNKKAYIVYTDKRKSIICYNLSANKIEQEKKNAHVESISNFRHFYIYDNSEYIMSVSYGNRQVKIWDFKKWEVKINLIKIYPEGFLYSACFLKNKNKSNFQFLTSNWVDNKLADYIRVYDFYTYKEKYSTIRESNDNVLFMDTFYDRYKNNDYIITSNKGYIKSYDYKKNILYNKYQDSKNYSNIYSFLIYIEDKNVKIIESSENGTIRVWHFHSGNLYSKFNIETNWIGGICLYSKDYILVGCGDKNIRLINVKEGILSDSLIGHEGKICVIKKLKIPNKGEYYFSLGKDNKIKKWDNLFNI